jgi:hypothetical protein
LTWDTEWANLACLGAAATTIDAVAARTEDEDVEEERGRRVLCGGFGESESLMVMRDWCGLLFLAPLDTQYTHSRPPFTIHKFRDVSSCALHYGSDIL